MLLDLLGLVMAGFFWEDGEGTFENFENRPCDFPKPADVPL